MDEGRRAEDERLVYCPLSIKSGPFLPFVLDCWLTAVVFHQSPHLELKAICIPYW
jgi:hypothetical protein